MAVETQYSPYFYGLAEQGSKNRRGVEITIPADLQKLTLDYQTQIETAKIRADLIRITGAKSSAGKHLTMVSIDIYYKLQGTPQNPFDIGQQLGMTPKQVRTTMVRYAQSSEQLLRERGLNTGGVGYVGAIGLVQGSCIKYGIPSEMALNIYNYSLALIDSSRVDLTRRPPQIGAAALIGHYLVISGYTVDSNELSNRLEIRDSNWVAEMMVTLGFAESSRVETPPQETVPSQNPIAGFCPN